MTNISEMHFILKIKFFVSGITIKVLSLRKTMHTKNFLSIINLKLSSFLYPFLSHFLFFFSILLLTLCWIIFLDFFDFFLNFFLKLVSFTLQNPFLDPLFTWTLFTSLSLTPSFPFFSGPPLLVITHRKKSRRSKTWDSFSRINNVINSSGIRR